MSISYFEIKAGSFYSLPDCAQQGILILKNYVTEWIAYHNALQYYCIFIKNYVVELNLLRTNVRRVYKREPL